VCAKEPHDITFADHTPRVLVVEDDGELREGLTELLTEEGYDVITARDGAEALGQVKRTHPPPCLVLLDLRMPVMNGVEFLQHLRRDPQRGQIPVCVMTAEPDVDPLPAEHVLFKPVNLNALLAVVARHCSGACESLGR
jgi:two-component system, chemotaxis family, chemotaxis protein CheY